MVLSICQKACTISQQLLSVKITNVKKTQTVKSGRSKEKRKTNSMI